ARGRRRYSWHRPSGVRDPRRQDHLQGRRAGADHADRAAYRIRRTDAARSQRSAHRHLRDRLRDPQSDVDIQVHRYDAAGRCLPQWTGPAGRGCSTRASSGGWTGPQHRCAGCGEPWMEAGPGNQAGVAGQPPRYLSRRAPPGRSPRAAQHDVASRASPYRRPYQGLGRHRFRLLRMDEPRKQLAAEMSGLDVHYDFGAGHPLLGRRMPDLELVTANGPLRVFTLLHKARPVLLNLGEPRGFDIAPWANRVQSIDAKYEGAWELPAIGAITAPRAVLVRPDGYVAWVGDKTEAGLADALATWFGPPTAA